MVDPTLFEDVAQEFVSANVRYPENPLLFGLIPARYFVFDGWFGRDKLGHFTRHLIFATIGVLLGGSAGAIAFYDTLFDGLYEHKDFVAGYGFSLVDFFYGRGGCAIVLIVAKIFGLI